LWRAARPHKPERAVARHPNVAIPDQLEGALDEVSAKELFARFAVLGVRETVVSTPQEAERVAREIGGVVVLKVLSAEITHKSDVGGVAVNLGAEAIGERLIRMKSDVLAATRIAPSHFVVQEMISDAVELILGFRRDHLGGTILLGMGGVAAELIRDRVIRMMPPAGALGEAEVMIMLQELKSWPLLDGFRGRPKTDLEALTRTVVNFSDMAAQLGPRLIEAEINPLLVRPEGKGVVAADGVVLLAKRARTEA
jgi:succinyl-CoA synthetase beta subunit